jgi:hypothetical protein
MKCVCSVLCCAVLFVFAATQVGAQDKIDLFDDSPSVVESASEADDLFGSAGGAPSAAVPSQAVQPATVAGTPAEKSLLEGLQPTADQSKRDSCKCVGESGSGVVEKIEKALQTPLRSTGLDFNEVPLKDMISLLQDDFNIPVQLDIKALDEIGLGPDEPVTASLHDISLRSALRLMLKQLQLTYIIRDEVLMITTPEEAERALTICVYDVTDLMDRKAATDFDSLIDMIVQCVETETWSENGGGEAEIRPIKPGLLVISQTQAVHEEICGLLETVRDVRARTPATPEEAGEPSAASMSDDDKVVTRYYPLSIPPATDLDDVLKQIRELITNSLPEQQWNGRLENGEAVVLAILPDRVIVRHTPTAQKEVEALLVDSGVANPQPVAGAQGFGEGRAFGADYGGDGRGFFQPRPTQ